MATTRPAAPSEDEPAGAEVAAEESGSGSRMVPLSDIIVTTSSKMVDLADPDVRRMLTELVTFEIDQASEFRRKGQSIDAVLQLTEAEKVSRALGMTESAQRIRTMMEEIRTAGLSGTQVCGGPLGAPPRRQERRRLVRQTLERRRYAAAPPHERAVAGGADLHDRPLAEQPARAWPTPRPSCRPPG